MTDSRQYALKVGLDDSASLSNFYTSDEQEKILLRQLRQPDFSTLYIYGAPSTGVTHLLSAAVKEQGGPADQYLPLAELIDAAPALLDGLPLGGLIAVDDIETIATDMGWQEALFRLFNRQMEHKGRLIFGGHCAAANLQIGLADLRSRILSGAVWSRAQPDESALANILTSRAAARGLQLSQAVVSYLLVREARDLHHLMALLERLDQMSLIDRKKLSVPWVAQWLYKDQETR